jgi:anti-sigma regulatory factor (Ser/Thr protein kinase)
MTRHGEGHNGHMGTDDGQMDLPDDGTAAGLGRAHARRVLDRWRLSSLTDSVTLVASELIGNAIRYGRPPFSLLLRRSGADVRVDVHDNAPELEPRLRRADGDAEGGRGLTIVEALTVDSGVTQVPGDGKSVWGVVRD